MSSDLITLAREKLAYKIGEELCRPDTESESHFMRGYNRGRFAQHSDLKPIVDALLNCADVLEKIILLMEGSPSIAPYTDAMVLELARQRRDELSQAVRGE